MSTWLKDTTLRDEVKKRDFSSVLETQLPLAKNLVASGKLNEALEMLLAVEKQARVANDLATLKETCASILTICFDCKEWSILKDQITVLAKRRGQKSSAVTVIVQKSMDYLKDAPSESVKVDLITALRNVSDGKIFVEKERAQLTQQLSQIKEKNGDVAGAADVLQEVHVETYGAMTKLEKCEFILEQVRLTLAKGDFIRAYILSKKILRRTLEENGFEQCKLKFYRLMIEYHTHENDTLELCRHWQAILNTKPIQDDENLRREALEHAVLYLILSPYSNHQNDMLHRLVLEKRLHEAPVSENLLKYFTTKEVVSYPFPEIDLIKQHPVMNVEGRGTQWLQDLHTRVIEHVSLVFNISYRYD